MAHHSGDPNFLAWGDGIDAALAAAVAEPIGAAAQTTANNAVPNATSRVRSAVLRDGTDQSATLNAEIAALAATGGGTIELPGSNLPITCSASITLADGVTLAGAGMNPINSGPTQFNFSTLATGSSPFVITDGSDIVLRDFYVHGWTAGGTAPVIAATGRRITIQRLTINATTTGAGIGFAVSAGSVITSSITGCVIVSCGYGIFIGGACTSINVANCYANLCTITGYHIQGTYITLSACAADGNTLYGYVLQNAVGVTLLSCGAENSGRTGFYLTGALGATLISCRAVNSNTSAGSFPSFLDLSSSSNYVTLIGCTDTTPNAATTWSITFTSGTPGTSFTALNCGGLVKGIHTSLVNRTVVGASSAVGGAGLNIPHGVAPTTPVNGDAWTTTAGLFARINGTTVGPFPQNAASVTAYSTGTGTITVPTGAKTLTAVLIGGGGGGGGGARGAAGGILGGGSGGGGGACSRINLDASLLGASVTYAVGVGGSAGTVASGDGQPGGNGGNGGATSLGTYATGTQFYAIANQGLGGTGGTVGGAGHVAGVGSVTGMFSGGNGGLAPSTGAAGSIGTSAQAAGAGGGAGGGLTAANVTSAGGRGSACVGNSTNNFGAAGTAGGGNAGAAVDTLTGAGLPGAGGGGGGSNTGAAGNGTAGGLYGAGGGGGGASQNTFASGAGGAGAPGLLLLAWGF